MDLIFIIGCARSGTSILGELISAHPDIRYLFEAHGIWGWGPVGSGINESHRLTVEHATPAVKERILKQMEIQAHGAQLMVEKNPRNTLRIPFLLEIFPSARFIHIVRDGRDTACSMVPGCGGAEWKHLKPPDWQEYYSKYNGVIRCAHVWKQVVQIAIQDLQKVDHLQVKYEELVISPLTTAKKIFSYMKYDLHPQVAEFCELISNKTHNSYHAKRQDKWFRDNHSYRIGRWKENLSETEKIEINRILQSTLADLGYSE